VDKAIEIKGLKKSFESIDAVDGVSFDVKSGEIFGLVGPDGAGKTTTIRMLCGLLTPDSGSASVLGFDIVRERKQIKRQIGYLSQRFSLYQDLTVDENIEFFAEIHGVRNFETRRNELLEFTRLTAFRKFLAGKLSGGMKQKLALACTLIHRPKIILLDEPTTGVDPVSRRDFWKILSNLHKEGITILISTPYLDEAERFNRIVMLDSGRLLRFDTPSNIINSLEEKIVEIVTPQIRKAYQLLKENAQFEAQMFGDRIDAALRSYEKDLKQIKQILESNDVEITDYRLKPASLENVFMHLLKNRN
jgi:ABC-2 type transport system ATP-binding protein